MIGFRDMTFCPHWRTCTYQAECPRRLTGCDIIGAIAWMPHRPVISQFMERPECHFRAWAR